ncbi:MAG TPA: cupin domain-containing protein [Azospirillum sp.]|nr:cupin domain-containing protein [Azospirillum sp.]
MDNLLRNLPKDLPDELFFTLAESDTVRIERIVSTGQSSPDGFWYDQEWDEFVVLVHGAASLEVEGEPERTLKPGDWLVIPSHVRHRVAWTQADPPTVWLAVHYRPTVGA